MVVLTQKDLPELLPVAILTALRGLLHVLTIEQTAQAEAASPMEEHIHAGQTKVITSITLVLVRQQQTQPTEG